MTNQYDDNNLNNDPEQNESAQAESNISDNNGQPNFISFVPPPEGSKPDEQEQQNVPPMQSVYNSYQNSTSSNQNQPPQNNYQSFYNVPPKKRAGNTPLLVGILVSVAILFSALIGLGLLGSGILTDKNTQGETSVPTTSQTVDNNTGNKTTPGGDISVADIPDSSVEGALSGTQIADKVTPSIVGVLNYAASSGDFNNYYGSGATQNKNSNNSKYTLSGQGSGIIVNVNNNDTEHTYIVTNQHVIADAAYVGIVLYDENGMTTDNQYQAEIIGQDSTTDLALLRIAVTGLTAADFADSDSLKKGETVYAIGNPGGLTLACSITQGIVSGVNRNIGSTNFIQTDASVNPGNSGGALVNRFGQVVGIISEKLLTVSTVDAEGLSFAIPTSVAKPILDDLLNHGYVTGRVTLNLSCETVSDMVAYFNNLPNDVRVRVTAVKEGSALAKQGLSVNDFIVEFNNTQIKTIDELATERDKYKAGDTITMKIYRYSTGKYQTITFNLEEDKGV